MSQHLPVIIIGGGIVGSTAGYYLTRAGYPVLIIDWGVGQATRAAAGIICPWLSKRRNQQWNVLVSSGAAFYRQFLNDLQVDGYESSLLFEKCGTLLIRKNQVEIDHDLLKAKEKQAANPIMGKVYGLSASATNQLIPFLDSPYPATFVEGGGRANGRWLVHHLHQAIQAQGGKIIRAKAQLSVQTKQLTISDGNQSYTADHLLLAVGPALNQLLHPLGLVADIRPQKGQLLSVYNPSWIGQSWPVMMTPGGIDILPFPNGEVVIGASHEDDQAFDLATDWQVLHQLKCKAQHLIPDLFSYPNWRVEVGSRAFTSTGEVLLGPLPNYPNHWVISGLGSSGLTSGPYLAYQWVQSLIQKDHQILGPFLSSHTLIQKKIR